MCQLQLIIKRNSKLNKEDLNEFYKMMSLGSIRNGDAYGVFNDKYNFKDNGIFSSRYLNKDRLLDSNFIVGHNRLATSGFIEEAPNPFFWYPKKKEKIIDNNKNNHPFTLNNLVLVHNGIISNYLKLKKEFNFNTEIKTDSYIILKLIDHFIKESNKRDRIDKIVEAIKETTIKLEGYYSVFLFDKVSNSLIYFKSEESTFYFLYNDKVIIGSTSNNNLDYCYFEDDLNYFRIKPKEIYLIKDLPKSLGSFKEKKVGWFSKSEESEKETERRNLWYVKNFCA